MDLGLIDELRNSTNSFYRFLFCPIEMKTNQIQRNSLCDKKFNLHQCSSFSMLVVAIRKKEDGRTFIIVFYSRIAFHLI